MDCMDCGVNCFPVWHWSWWIFLRVINDVTEAKLKILRPSLSVDLKTMHKNGIVFIIRIITCTILKSQDFKKHSNIWRELIWLPAINIPDFDAIWSLNFYNWYIQLGLEKKNKKIAQPLLTGFEGSFCRETWSTCIRFTPISLNYRLHIVYADNKI